MPYAICPGCSEELRVRGRVRIGRRVYCPTCEEEMEVVDIDPIELDFAYESAESNGVGAFGSRPSRSRPLAGYEQEGDDALGGPAELDEEDYESYGLAIDLEADEDDEDDDLYDQDGDAWVSNHRFAVRG